MGDACEVLVVSVVPVFALHGRYPHKAKWLCLASRLTGERARERERERERERARERERESARVRGGSTTASCLCGKKERAHFVLKPTASGRQSLGQVYRRALGKAKWLRLQHSCRAASCSEDESHGGFPSGKEAGFQCCWTIMAPDRQPEAVNNPCAADIPHVFNLWACYGCGAV